MKTKLLISLFALIFSFYSNAQLVMQNGSWTECDFILTDSGNTTSNYSNNEDVTLTLCPPNDNEFVSLEFFEFSTELNADFLAIYDGSSNSSPLIGSYSGTDIPTFIQADNSSGCLTLRFISNNTGTTSGWSAEVLCNAGEFVINQPTDYEVCDTDFDDFYEFDLYLKDAEILGGLSPNNYQVTYYETQVDANTAMNPLISPYTNIANPQTIYVNVIENSTGNTQQTSLTLFVNVPQPPNLQDIYELCEGSVLTIDAGLTDPNNQYSWYYNGVLIANEFSPILQVTESGAYALEVLTALGCFSITDFEVTINDLSNIASSTNYIICDDNDDGFATFDLDSKILEITNENNDPTLIVTFHETQNDAFNNTNALSSPYNNTTQSSQTIYVRVSAAFGDCSTVVELELIVDVNCISSSPAIINICGDDPNIPIDVDLTTEETNIVNGQDITNFTFQYYLSQTDAEAQINSITNPNSFNVSGNSVTVFVRIEENGSGDVAIVDLLINFNLSPQIEFDDTYAICSGNEIVLTPNINGGSGAGLTFLWSNGQTDPEIVVNEAGLYSVTVTDSLTSCSGFAEVQVNLGEVIDITAPQNLTSCDTNGVFNLTSIIPDVLNGLDPNNYNIAFYDDFSNAFTQINSLATPDQYTATTNPQTIFIRVGNLNDDCFALGAFDLITEDCPITIDCGDEPVNTTYCYDNNDTTEFSFQSDSGEPLTIFFNAGSTEVTFDEVTILDSDGSIMNPNLPFGNDGDFSGLSYTSTGGTIIIAFSSDASISCASGSNCCTEQFDFDVYCSTSVGIIEVNAFVDVDANMIFDSTEPNFSNGYFTYEMNNDGNINTVNSSTGSFQILSLNETDVFEITFNLYEESAGCYDISTNTFGNISVINGATEIVNFAIIEEQSCEDLAVYLINYWTPPRPGFQHENYLVLENLGFTTITSGTIEFTTDSQLIYNGVTAVNSNYTINNTATGFTVDFVNLQSGDLEYIDISLTCPATVELGEILTNTANYVTASNDLVASNNYSTLSEVVVGSWDPNDKMESHGPKLNYENFVASNEWLYYTIRFQNLGTFAAEFVRIDDALDSQLDETTFQMLRSSHDYVVTRTDRDLEWFFESINLPAEQDDEEGSQGFVYFRIKPNTGYAIGDIIPNTASIFFDFNAPVITNTFSTEFVEDALSIGDADFTGFNIFPNPANDHVTIRLNANTYGNVTVKVIDLQGKLILEEQISEENNFELDIADLQSGLYFVKLNANNKSLVKKLIIE